MVTTVFIVATCITSTQASYTGLVNIPTAETLEFGQYGIEMRFDGTFAQGNADTRFLNTEFGIHPRFEAGVDFDLSHETETRMLLNAKYLVSMGGAKQPALAIGVYDVGHGIKATPYLVATQDFRKARVHLGAARIDEHDRLFVGLDHAVNDKLTLMADYTGGADNSATIGANYQCTDTFGILTGVIFPNSADGETAFTIYFSLNGPFQHINREK